MPSPASLTAAAPSSDASLCAAALQGDRAAFRQIVERYQNLVCSIAYSALGDVGRSEDLAQETFVIAWRSLGDLKEPAKLKAWLCGITRRLVSNNRRQTATDVAVQAEALGGRDAIADDAAGPPEIAIRREEEYVLWEVLSRLPPQFREPLVLYHRGEQSVAEVAAQLDLSEDAVKQRLARGRKLLQTEVAAFVEKSLRGSRPGAAFAVAVLAALPAAAPQVSAAALIATAKGAGAKAAAAGSAGLAGAIFGPLLGIVGAALGVTASIKSARSPRERRFMIQLSIVVVGLVAALLAIQAISIRFFLVAYRTIAFQLTLWGAYSVLLVLLIVWANRRTKRIRDEDGTTPSPSSGIGELADAPLRAATWSLAGMMYGGVCWVAVAGMSAGDWLAPTVAFALTALAWMSIKRWLESSDTTERRLLAMLYAVIAIATISIAVASFRWSAWHAVPNHAMISLPLWATNAIVLAVCTGVAIYLLNRWRSVRRSTANLTDPNSTPQ